MVLFRFQNDSAWTDLQLPLWQCLPLTVVQLKGKHCRKPHCHNGVVDMFGPCLFAACKSTGHVVSNVTWINFALSKFKCCLIKILAQLYIGLAKRQTRFRLESLTQSPRDISKRMAKQDRHTYLLSQFQ